MVQDKTLSNRIVDLINYTLLLIFGLAAVLPFFYVIAVSFTDPAEVARGD